MNQKQKNIKIGKEASYQNDRSLLKKLLLYLKSFLPLLLSHHPDCDRFKEHTLKIGKIKLCIGCFLGYSAAIIILMINAFLKFEQLILSQYLLILAVIFLSTFIPSLFNLIRKKIIKTIQKIFMGIGGGLLIIWILNLPNPRTKNLIIMFYTINILITIFSLYHIYTFFNNCYKCEANFNWGICSGFEKIRAHMKENNLDNLFLKFEDFSYKIKTRKLRKKIK